MSFQTFIFSLIILVIAVVVFPIAHEQDIARQCRMKGNSGSAGWTVRFTCENY